jgi:MurNAc alpha-1-phosphate uridylyltransferase
MNTMPRKAMVLAAGLGTRMRPLTDVKPKPLIEVCGKALIDYSLDQFAAAGVETAVVNVHYFADQIEAHLANRHTPQIEISDERSLLMETGGALKQARSLLGEDPFFCTNTDAILHEDEKGSACRQLAAIWPNADCDALLLLTPREKASGYDGPGDFEIDQTARLEWRAGGSAQYVFTGLQIISPSLLQNTPDHPFSTKLLWEKAKENGRLRGVVFNGDWMHVGDPKGLALAEAFLNNLPE